MKFLLKSLSEISNADKNTQSEFKHVLYDLIESILRSNFNKLKVS